MLLLLMLIPVGVHALLLAMVLSGSAVVALAVDQVLGEPPSRWHPVVWMGRYLGWTGRWVQARTRQVDASGRDLKAFWLGALVWVMGCTLVLIASSALQCVLVGFSNETPVVGWSVGSCLLATIVLGFLLKPMLAWALLKDEVLAVEAALSHPVSGSLQAGRDRLRWLVSRDVATLSESQVRESAIETLAENLNDSVVAPLFWFALLGLPGAALFRFANTADAMWGYPGVYQGHNWAWAGKWAARADDVLGWLPARLTALLVCMAAWVVAPSTRGRMSLARLRTEAARTPSPNSGWPMAAMALALNVRLGKPGGYVLNGAASPPQAEDTHLAVRLARNSVVALVFIACAAILFIVVRFFTGVAP